MIVLVLKISYTHHIIRLNKDSYIHSTQFIMVVLGTPAPLNRRRVIFENLLNIICTTIEHHNLTFIEMIKLNGPRVNDCEQKEASSQSELRFAKARELLFSVWGLEQEVTQKLSIFDI